jgi:glutaredoxin
MKEVATVWSQPNCAHCKSAKALLLQKGYTYIEKMIGEGYTKKDLIDVVPHARSVPQIFLGDEYVGGYAELVKRI